MTNEWIRDEALKDIDPAKLEFLQALVFESSSLKKEQMLPFLLAVAKRSQEKNMTFTNEEMDAVASVLKKYAAEDELVKINKILAMRNRR
jgi:hypothetical protein